MKTLNVSNHPAKFGGHKHCGSGGKMALVCQVILQDHVTKGSNNNELDPLRLSHHPVNFGGYMHCVSGDIMVLVCTVISQDHVVKRLFDFRSGRPSRLSYHPP